MRKTWVGDAKHKINKVRPQTGGFYWNMQENDENPIPTAIVKNIQRDNSNFCVLVKIMEKFVK